MGLRRQNSNPVISASELEDIEGRWEQATPGPWGIDGSHLITLHPAVAARGGGDNGLQYSDGGGWQHEGDLAFIAASWNDVRRLLVYVDHLQTQVARLQTELEAAKPKPVLRSLSQPGPAPKAQGRKKEQANAE